MQLWACAASGLGSHARFGERFIAHLAYALLVLALCPLGVASAVVTGDRSLRSLLVGSHRKLRKQPSDPPPAISPYSGAPFLREIPLRDLPSQDADRADTGVIVSRLKPNEITGGKPGACNGITEKSKCLAVKGVGCMFVQLMKPPVVGTPPVFNDYCFPCEVDGTAIPCWDVGAYMGEKQVTDCEMTCMHQARVLQPQVACSDAGGSEAQCMDAGKRTRSKCMFLIVEDKMGTQKGSCGPCEVTGSGSWGCPPVGSEGSEPGSKVFSCRSQCDAPLPVDTETLSAFGLPASPGVVKVAAPATEMQFAPLSIAAAMPPAAPPPTPVTPMIGGTKNWVPVVIYPAPSVVAATTVEPPLRQTWYERWPNSDPAELGAGDGLAQEQ